jgi:hypothetical protein
MFNGIERLGCFSVNGQLPGYTFFLVPGTGPGVEKK